MLLDEPFGALDAKVRKELRRWLRQLHDQLQVTSVFVTHDQDEALEVADRITVMNEGKIEQEGTPQEVYEKPANPFVYNFLGSVNLFRGRVHNGKVTIGGAELADAAEGQTEKTGVVAYVRPHDVEISPTLDEGFTIPATVLHINAAGPIVRIQLHRSDTGESVEAELTRDLYHHLGLQNRQSVYIRIRNPRVFVEDYII